MIEALKRFFALFVFWKMPPPEFDALEDFQPSTPPTVSVAQPSGPSMAGMRRTIADNVTALLDRLLLLDKTSMENTLGSGDAIQRTIPYLLGCDFHLIDDWISMIDEAQSLPERLFCTPEEEELHEVTWPVDIAVAARKDNGLDDRPGVPGFILRRIYTRLPSEFRGQCSVIPQKIVSSIGLWLPDGPSEKWRSDVGHYGLIAGQWRPLKINRIATQSMGGHVECYTNPSAQNARNNHIYIQMSLSVGLTERYNWHVALGQGDAGPRILLPTSPAGCLSLFKNRVKPDGASRRAALRHWVSKHYREAGDFGIAFVREHLRGATRFDWADLSGEILVSGFDLEKNEFFRTQAEEWRATRKHNRVRVRLKKRGGM